MPGRESGVAAHPGAGAGVRAVSGPGSGPDIAFPRAAGYGCAKFHPAAVGMGPAVAATAAAGGTGATFIPPNCLNYDGVTIDEMSVDDMSTATGAPVVAPESFVEALCEHAASGSGRK